MESSDTIVSGTAALVLFVIIARNMTAPESLRFEPYPTLGAPEVDLPLMLALAALLVPAFFAPGAVDAASQADR